MNKLLRFLQDHKIRQVHCTRSREPFFELAGKYLPSDEKSIVVDIGAGSGGFPHCLKLAERYENLFLLDGNEATVASLRAKYKNVLLWQAPGRLPFDDSSVGFVHSSHMIEHLEHDELYKLLKETDRVLGAGGVLVISSPLIWEGFYGNLTHIKPYTQQVLINYLCEDHDSSTKERLSKKYSVEDLAYRYRILTGESGQFGGSEYFVMEALTRIIKGIWYRLGFRRYEKTGYTLVLKKSAIQQKS